MTIKELREKNKLTQAAFADALGVTGKYIYLIESGKSNLSKKLSDKIAEVYGEVIEPAEKKVKTAAVKAEKKAKTTAAKAEKKADKAAADAAQAVLDAEKKIDKKKRKARSKAQADKPAVEAVAEAIAAPVEAAAEAAAAPIEAVKEKKARRRAVKPAMNIVIQSPLGGEITAEEIRARIGEADTVYVRVDQNKAYWVHGDETGDIDLW